MPNIALICICLTLSLSPLMAGVPDEPHSYPTWTLFLSAVALIGAFILIVDRLRKPELPPAANSRKAAAAYGALVAWALLSALARIALNRGHPTYLDNMIRGWSAIAIGFALFMACREIASRSRLHAYILVLAMAAAAAIVSGLGTHEYLIHYRAGESDWRVFSTSTPDFLAGYLVMLIPVTLALFIAVPAEQSMWQIYGLALVLDLLTVETTVSRFALVSLLVSLVIFAGTVALSMRRGLTLRAENRTRIRWMLIISVLGCVVMAKPLINRVKLLHTEANSGLFRIWTWRGCVKMLEANPIIGTGPGTFVDTYPRYALTGFTRLAHEGYLQLGDDCGIPALLAIVLTLSLMLRTMGRRIHAHENQSQSEEAPSGAATASQSAPKASLNKATRRRPDTHAARDMASDGSQLTASERFLAAVAPTDDRWLLCGLAGAIAASALQNIIDSDWYVFFIGAAFSSLSGVAMGMSDRGPLATDVAAPSRRPGRGLLIAAAAVTALLAVVNSLDALAAVHDANAGDIAAEAQAGLQSTGGHPDQAQFGNAEQEYQSAIDLAPENGQYASDLGFEVYYSDGSLSLAESELQRALNLEPTASGYQRLALVYQVSNRTADALTALNDGLKCDPNSLELMLTASRICAPNDKLDWYKRITRLEDSPVGKVRAIDLAETKFAVADSAVADDALSRNDQRHARQFYARAATLLEQYAYEGGSANPQRMATTGLKRDLQMDQQMSDLYTHVVTSWDPIETRPAVLKWHQTNLKRFRDILASK